VVGLSIRRRHRRQFFAVPWVPLTVRAVPCAADCPRVRSGWCRRYGLPGGRLGVKTSAISHFGGRWVAGHRSRPVPFLIVKLGK
jgi:hypothetical protein